MRDRERRPRDGGFHWFVQINHGECGARTGSVVSFTVDGREASETALWESGLTTLLELTVPDGADGAAGEPGPDAPASPEGEPPAAATVTTSLHPGWNLVGWVGPTTPASELFGRSDPRAHRGLRVGRRGAALPGRDAARPRSEPGQLARGQGLWLHIGGGRTVEWVRALSGEGRLASLRPGLNLVAWTGRDQVPAEEALARLGGR